MCHGYVLWLPVTAGFIPFHNLVSGVWRVILSAPGNSRSSDTQLKVGQLNPTQLRGIGAKCIIYTIHGRSFYRKTAVQTTAGQ